MAISKKKMGSYRQPYVKIDLGRPNSEPQKRFFASKALYTCYGGARGGGKSWAVRTKAVGGALRYPGIKILIIRRTYRDMATTAQWVFDKAIYLMDEQNESSGATVTGDTAEYKLRTLGILNVLRHELYPYSDTFAVTTAGKRPVCAEITAFTDEIGLDDVLAQGVLPYGLAAHLLLGENDSMANYFSQRYRESLAAASVSMPSEIEDIPLCYGGMDC